MGYKWFDAMRLTPAFCFGHGIGYSKFEYREIKVETDTVSFTLTNVGSVEAAEVAQLYISFPPGAGGKC